MTKITDSPRIDSVPEKKERDPRLLEAAQSFENQFLRQMLSEMRKTIPKDELIGESMAEDIFRGQLDDEYAKIWEQSGGIGLTDIIYDQLQQKIEDAKHPRPSFVSAAPTAGPRATSGVVDIFQRADRDLFVAKKSEGGTSIRSKEPLAERVDLRAPMSGLVLQAAALEDGRQMIVIKHDQGLVSQFVHTGANRVRTNTRVQAGEPIAALLPSQKGEGAEVFFGLRKTPENE